MIRTRILSSFLVFVFFISTQAAEEKYGKEITLKDKTPISVILESPEKFEGKTVLVEGTVAAVCEHRGCWIDIESENEKIKVKVEDGVIVFPTDAKGKLALVEGVVAEVKDDSCDTEHSESSENKESSGCCSVEKKVKNYRIEGLGALIK